MPLNRRVRRHEQQNRIKARFGRVTEKHFGMDAGEARASDLITVNRAAIIGSVGVYRRRSSAAFSPAGAVG